MFSAAFASGKVVARSKQATFALLALITACASPRASVEVAASAQLRVVSYNIRHGRGMDDRVDLERTAAVLRALDPDIIGLQEVDSAVERSGRIDEAALLGRRLGLHHAFGSFFDYQGGRYGMAILSRFPVRQANAIRLPDGNEPRIALAVTVDHPRYGELLVVNVHFDWVADDAFRYSQAERLAAVLDTVSLPYVLLGDFNDTPGSRTLDLFQQRAREADKPAERRFTFSSTDPQKEIDFVFAAPAASWVADTVRVIDERMASDHRPVLAVLRLR